ncbi:MAG: ATP-grasp domain-containing protein [Magnetococcus sp. DMHC-6]
MVQVIKGALGFPKVALFGPATSKQMAAMGEAVAGQGGIALRFDLHLGRGRKPPLLASRVRMEAQRLLWDGVEFGDIYAIYIRGRAVQTPEALPGRLDGVRQSQWRSRYWQEQANQATVMGFMQRLLACGRLVVNPLTKGYPEHNAKSWFYEKLRGAGFLVPKSITTNDPERVATFLQAHEQGVVVKPMIGVGSTRVVSVADRGYLERVRYASVLLQERVFGEHLRVHVVGDRVVLCVRVIFSGEVDSRVGIKRVEESLLDPQQEAQIVCASRFLGLHFCAWDVIREEGGRVFLLDCNPGPYVMWLGERFSKLILWSLAGYLVNFARDKM